jgi:hypothetical protein
MLLSLHSFVMRSLLQAMARPGRGDFEREVELLAVRHQLKVLSRVLAGRRFAGKTGCCSRRRAGSFPTSMEGFVVTPDGQRDRAADRACRTISNSDEILPDAGDP